MLILIWFDYVTLILLFQKLSLQANVSIAMVKFDAKMKNKIFNK